MPEVSIRQVETDEEILRDLNLIGNYAFGVTPPLQTDEEQQAFLPYQRERRFMVAYEDGQARALAASLDMTQNVRGKIYAMGGISPVATHPLGRRNGYARQCLVSLFKVMRDAGHVFTGLYPFRESFYERMGYVTFPRAQKIDFETASLAKLLKMELPGEVDMQLIKDGCETIFNPFLEHLQTSMHGMSLFTGRNAERIGDKNEYWLVSARFGDDVEGVMLYKVTSFGGTFEVPRFLTLTSRARYALLGFIARHIDQTKTVNIMLRPGERPQTWFSDMTPRHNPDIWITAMARVLDVAQLSGMQVGEGSFTARISDSQCDWNNGVWSFSSNGGVLRIAPADNPEVDLTIQGLTALVYGTHDPHDFVFRGWGEPSSELIERVEMLFPRQNPYMFSHY